MTSLMTLRLSFAFKGRYPVFLLTSSFKFRMQTAFQINLLPFSITFIRRLTVRIFVQYGRYNKPVRKRLIANFMTPF